MSVFDKLPTVFGDALSLAAAPAEIALTLVGVELAPVADAARQVVELVDTLATIERDR